MELVMLSVGVILGVIITVIYDNIRTSGGILKVRQDDDGTYLFLELTREAMNDIHKKGRIVLKIDHTHE